MARPDPWAALRKQVAGIPVIDCHEHLPNEADRLRQPVDFFTLFSHYCVGDLVAAGAPPATMAKLQGPDTPVAEKWALFAPFYASIADGAYARCAHRAIRRFYEMDPPASAKDAAALSDRVRAANVPGLYRRVLREACGIVTSLNNTGVGADAEFFRPVRGVDALAAADPWPGRRALEKEVGRDLPTLARYVRGACDAVEADLGRGLKGLKFGAAYSRPLYFADVAEAEAARVFDRVFADPGAREGPPPPLDEVRPLQDYLVHRLVALAGDLGLTAVFHTGLQAGNENTLDNARPERLTNLFRGHPKTRFDVFHCGLPWVEEAGILAKYFANVWVDFAWVHAISPEMAARALRTYVDMVPRNKVLGFGGDYLVVEKVYGHLELARDGIARALSDRVADGAFTEDAALAWARAMLHDNPIAAYALDIKPLG